jgi:hypothetical protein
MLSSVQVEGKVTGTVLELMFSYDPQEGVFRHKTYRGPRPRGPGSIVGTAMAHGYVMITVCQKKFTAHRLAWLWMTGKWPIDEIDHINGIRDDNRFSNLREASRSQNGQNGGIRSTNKTGRIGVHFDRSRKKFVADIMMNGKRVFRRRYNALDVAVAARARKEVELFGEFAPGRRQGLSRAEKGEHHGTIR